MRRRMMGESKQGFKPYYSNYPIFTEYGTYRLTPQTDNKSMVNTYIKLDDTSYNWRGSSEMSRVLQVIYTVNTFKINQIVNEKEIKWIEIKQESKVAGFKRCGGAESDTAVVEYYVEKVD